MRVGLLARAEHLAEGVVGRVHQREQQPEPGVDVGRRQQRREDAPSDHVEQDGDALRASARAGPTSRRATTSTSGLSSAQIGRPRRREGAAGEVERLGVGDLRGRPALREPREGGLLLDLEHAASTNHGPAALSTRRVATRRRNGSRVDARRGAVVSCGRTGERLPVRGAAPARRSAPAGRADSMARCARRWPSWSRSCSCSVRSHGAPRWWWSTPGAGGSTATPGSGRSSRSPARGRGWRGRSEGRAAEGPADPLAACARRARPRRRHVRSRRRDDRPDRAVPRRLRLPDGPRARAVRRAAGCALGLRCAAPRRARALHRRPPRRRGGPPRLRGDGP